MELFNRSEYLPVHEQLTDYIKQKIMKGEFTPSTKLPPEREWAVELNISRPTLRKSITKLCHEGLLVHRNGKGTFVAEIKQGIFLQKKTIGLIFPTGQISSIKQSPYSGTILEELTNNTSDYYNLQILNKKENEEYLEIYHKNIWAGIIIIAPRKEEREELIKLKKAGIPYMVIGASFKNTELNTVDCDNTGGTVSAVEYLIKLGHKRIGFVSGHLSEVNNIDRLEGYKISLKKNKIELREELIITSVSAGEVYENTGIRAANTFLSFNNRPTAIVFADHMSAIGAMRTLKEKGLNIPKDISIIGFDDPELVSYLDPPLTVVRQKLQKMSGIALEEIKRRLTSSVNKSFQANVETELVIRGSCIVPKKD